MSTIFLDDSSDEDDYVEIINKEEDPTTFKDLPVEIKTIITTKGYDFQAIKRFAQTSKENFELAKNAFKKDNMCTQAIKRNYGAFKTLCTDGVTVSDSNILQPCTGKKVLSSVCPKEKKEWDDWHMARLFTTKKCRSALCQNRFAVDPNDSWEDYCQTCRY